MSCGASADAILFDMQSVTITREAFVELVRQALGLLNLPQLLHAHPLATCLSNDGAPLDGEEIQRALVDAIRALRPAHSGTQAAVARRRYRYLWLRYVEGLAPPDVARSLGVTDRQARRDHRDAIESVAALLWVRFTGAPWETTETGAEDDRRPGHAAVSSLDEPLALELARLTGDVPTGPISLSEALDGVLRTVARLLADHRLEPVVEIQDDLPTAAVNGVVLRQILMSVLGHICQAAGPGALEIVARSANDRLQVDLVYQQRSPESATIPTTDEDPLVLARQIAEVAGASVAERPGAERQVIVTLVVPAARPVTVLVVDDNLDFLRLTRRVLEIDDYRVLEASVPSEALRLAREAHPDAIILDVLMPTIDGWDLLATLRRDPATSHIPVLVCSVLRSPALVAQMGGAGFLPKPFTPAGLLSALQRVGMPTRAR